MCRCLNILWHCLSLGLEWKLTFSSPVATDEFSKSAGILSAALWQHHLRVWNSSSGISVHYCFLPLFALFLRSLTLPISSCLNLLLGILEHCFWSFWSCSTYQYFVWFYCHTVFSVQNVLLLLFSCSLMASSSAISWSVARRAPLSTEFPKQECWSGLPFSSPGDLPNPRIESTPPISAGRFFITEPPGKPCLDTLQFA